MNVEMLNIPITMALTETIVTCLTTYILGQYRKNCCIVRYVA